LERVFFAVFCVKTCWGTVVVGCAWLAPRCCFLVARSRGNVDDRNLDAQAALDYKAQLKADIVAKRRRNPLPHYGVVVTYPPDPREFIANNVEIARIAFPSGAPMECPVDMAVFNRLKANLPCRVTHTSARSQSALTRRARSTSRQIAENDVPIPGMIIFDRPEPSRGGRLSIEGPGAAQGSSAHRGFSQMRSGFHEETSYIQSQQVAPIVASSQFQQVAPIADTSSQSQQVAPIDAASQSQQVTPIGASSQHQQVTPIDASSQHQQVVPIDTSSQSQQVSPIDVSSQSQQVVPIDPSYQSLQVAPIETSSQSQQVVPVDPSYQSQQIAPIDASSQFHQVAPVDPSYQSQQIAHIGDASSQSQQVAPIGDANIQSRSSGVPVVPAGAWDPNPRDYSNLTALAPDTGCSWEMRSQPTNSNPMKSSTDPGRCSWLKQVSVVWEMLDRFRGALTCCVAHCSDRSALCGLAEVCCARPVVSRALVSRALTRQVGPRKHGFKDTYVICAFMKGRAPLPHAGSGLPSASRPRVSPGELHALFQGLHKPAGAGGCAEGGAASRRSGAKKRPAAAPPATVDAEAASPAAARAAVRASPKAAPRKRASPKMTPAAKQKASPKVAG
jgi:hypothetical protein